MDERARTRIHIIQTVAEIFPYLCFGKKSHNWSNTECRPDVLLKCWDGCKVEQFEASRHKGWSGRKVLVIRTDDALDSWASGRYIIVANPRPNPSTLKGRRRWKMINTAWSHLFGCKAWWSGWVNRWSPASNHPQEGRLGLERRKTFTPWGGIDSPSCWRYSCLGFGSRS
jgi:hypothetical protein